MPFKRNDDVVKSLIGTPTQTQTKPPTPAADHRRDLLDTPDTGAARSVAADQTDTQTQTAAADTLLDSIQTMQVPLSDANGKAVFNYHVKPDGEKRSHRLQLTCKESIAKKLFILTRFSGVSMNYYFENLINDAWEKWKDENGNDFQKGKK